MADDDDDPYFLPDHFLTGRELVEDIRRRLILAPRIAGTDTRALPPVSRHWILKQRERNAE